MTFRVGPVVFVIYRKATRSWGIVMNRYNQSLIGAALAMGRYCASLQWRRAP